MGVGQKTLRRLLDLRRAGLIGPNSRMLELGSQNVRCEGGGAYLHAFISEFRGEPISVDSDELEKIAAGGLMARLMKLCGVRYSAVDIFDAEDTILFDLNTDAVPEDLRGQFDLITNFGTSEHVLDQRHTFEVTHDFVKTGGVIYHDLPMGGYFYHGYFSYTPLFFNHLALANGYEVVFRHFSKVPGSAPFTRPSTDELRDNGWPDPGFHDVGIEFIFRKTKDVGFRLPVEVGTSLAVNRLFLETRRDDIEILAGFTTAAGAMPERDRSTGHQIALPEEIVEFLDPPPQATESPSRPDEAVSPVVPSGRGLPPDMLSAIEQHGGRAFIVLRLRNTGAERVLICPDQNGCEVFAETLSEASRDIGGCLFLDALRCALLGDVYEAAFAFFDWIYQPGDSYAPELLVFDASDKPFPGYCGSPIYDYNQLTRLPVETSSRAAMLMAMFNAYEGTIGDDAVRDWLMAALAFALSRHCGLTGEYDIGSNFVDRALAFGDRPNEHRYVKLLLEACRHVLDLKRRGLEVHPRLEKFAGRDNGYLNEVVCGLPYTNMEIGPNGEVHICCGSIVPDSIGNIETADVDQIINSDMAKKIRHSVVDGTFKYCDHVNCPLLVRDSLPRKDSAEVKSDPAMRMALEEHIREVQSVRSLRFGYDFSCNLSCPSCRTEVLTQKFSDGEPARKAIDEKLTPLLPSLERLFINSTGEFLVSKPSRLLLQAIDPALCSKLNIDILSNGTLFSEAEWQKFSNIHGMVRSVKISTDAASAATFEKVRRGGKWEIFWRNINFLGRMNRDNRIGEFHLAFTYQLANFREMKAFVRMCEDIGADRAVFQRLFPTSAMTDAEYQERAVHKPDHPLHLEFLEIINDTCFKQPNVVVDFEFSSETGTTATLVAKDALDVYGSHEDGAIKRDEGEATEAERVAVDQWIQSILDRFADPDLNYQEIVQLVEAYIKVYGGETFPPLLEKKALDLALACHPDRDDLRARLEQVEKSLAEQWPLYRFSEGALLLDGDMIAMDGIEEKLLSIPGKQMRLRHAIAAFRRYLAAGHPERFPLALEFDALRYLTEELYPDDSSLRLRLGYCTAKLSSNMA